MFKFRRRILQSILLLASARVHAGQDPLAGRDKPPGPHPRLLLAPGQEAAIRARIAGDATARRLHEAIVAECDVLLDIAPVKRTKVGKSILVTSREVLRRVFFLSYAFRISRQQKYASRAEQEMLAAASFSDWNPSHFLDVAEMATALAIGYDWLYECLPEPSRQSIRTALGAKALDPSLLPQNSAWTTNVTNWNQVCNAGMVLAALAVYEDDPDKAQRVIRRAVETIALPMNAYEPDGVYPEGYSYWNYGTTYNVLLINALETAFGSDFGILDHTGFLKTAEFVIHVVGPTGQAFNYADSRTEAGFLPAAPWFGQRLHDPSVMWAQQQFLQHLDVREYERSRFLPAALLWMGSGNPTALSPPTRLAWMGKGPGPVAMFRTSWTDPNAIYVGVKAGTPSSNHGHMDIGSFVMESDGVRWAVDLGMQNYPYLESQHVDLWNMKQDSQRWQIFALNNFSHNTLTVNGQRQRVNGMATLRDFSDAPRDMGVTVDLGSIYQGQLQRATRRITLEDQALVAVRDEVQAGEADAVVRWAMLTPAQVRLVDAHTAQLAKDGKTLRVRVSMPGDATLATWPATPQHTFDAPNPGMTLLGFETRLKAGASASFKVELLTPHAKRF